MRNLVDPVQLTEPILFSSTFHEQSIMLTSKLSKLVFVFLTTSMNSDGIWNDDSVGKYNCSLSITWWRSINSPDILQKSSLASMASASVSELSETPPSTCKKSHHAHCKGSLLASPKVGCTPSASMLSTLWWRKCATFLSQGTVCAKNRLKYIALS